MSDDRNQAAAGMTPAQGCDGGGPGKGTTLPPYYRPTPSVKSSPTASRRSRAGKA